MDKFKAELEKRVTNVTEAVLPTYAVNAEVKKAGYSMLTVKQIKTMGIMPVYEVQGGSSVLWRADTPDKIIDYLRAKHVKATKTEPSLLAVSRAFDDLKMQVSSVERKMDILLKALGEVV